MIGQRSVLALVPARGGSKGIRHKNLAETAGLPLIAWTLRAAADSSVVDRTVVSTDDEEIAAVARAHGAEVPFLRPTDLARDDTPTMAVVEHALAQVEDYDYLILLQPTSPLRTSRDIDEAVGACDATGACSCVSVTPVEKSPHWMYFLQGDRLEPILPPAPRSRRQDLRRAYALNGAVYVARVPWLRGRDSFLEEGTIAHVMSRARSLDVDEPEDLAAADALLRELRDVDAGGAQP